MIREGQYSIYMQGWSIHDGLVVKKIAGHLGGLAFLTASSLTALTVGCGGGSSTPPPDAAETPDVATTPDAGVPDATPPDAPLACGDASTCGTECVDTTTDPLHCGDCLTPCASAARNCVASNCECPDDPLVPMPLMPLIEQMDTTSAAPAVLGIGAFADADSLIDAVVVGYDPATTPLDVDIDLASVPAGGTPFVALGYDINLTTMTPRAGFRSTTGTLRLTRRCTAGVAGTITGVQTVELTSPLPPPVPVPGGCTITIPAVDFDFGGPCP
jgi:hypothetical protein